MAFILFGDGYSVKEFFMNNIRVALTSKMYKFWGIILSIALLSFFILLIANFQEIPLYAIIFVFLTFIIHSLSKQINCIINTYIYVFQKNSL